jgi:hypothetical protein
VVRVENTGEDRADSARILHHEAIQFLDEVFRIVVDSNVTDHGLQQVAVTPAVIPRQGKFRLPRA